MAANQNDSKFKLDNVHSATVFELRQECERRSLELPNAISHASLMQCLIKDLLREKQEEERRYAERLEEERRDLQAHAPSQVSMNEIWREVIRREDNALRKQKRVYSCNLNALRKDRITEAPGFRAELRRELSPEEDAEATKILESYGFKTRAEDPSTIRVPITSSGQFGNFLYFAYPDDRRTENVRKCCEETKYAKNFAAMTGKSAFAKQS
ncbi:Hypothetical Protein FCC1311_113372 [Hondaea fermentalgiana]|uniref:Uncharacterized protein n=1 Tax=Hondaea fermentalgiana TaxID=2315210 RepID=A0A2R5H3V2_9STRA|nr:Hypothetical Protein FCC1311_113372 [Hondaea fermentalgiana]|eukprot:GBG35114.1 Hypothetical Protein FCC1311_113372 [Hondaea fermentalgiana]